MDAIFCQYKDAFFYIGQRANRPTISHLIIFDNFFDWKYLFSVKDDSSFYEKGLLASLLVMKMISSITLILAHRIRKRRFKKLLNLGLQRPLILNDRWAEKIEVHVGRLEAGSISDLQFPSAGIC